MSSCTIDSFTVKNFRSIYEEQTIFFSSDKPVTAFYGANASGKTNIYRAMSVFRKFIKKSTDPNSYGVPYEPFLLRVGSVNEPSVFSIVFHNDESKYRYSFSLLGEKVAEEEMYDLTSSRPRTIFIRKKGATEQAAKNGFGKKMFDGNDAVRDDSLLITLAQRTKNKYANAVFDVINNMAMLTLIDARSMRGYAVDVLQKQPELSAKVIKLLKETDFAITDFNYNVTKITSDMLAGAPFSDAVKDELIKNGRNISIGTTHALRNKDGDKVGVVAFDMERQESLGTNIFFNLIIMIINAMDNGKILFLDEFGSSLHTSICQYVINLFKKNGIKTGAKLIINTHDTGLIRNGTSGILDKDEIIIVEKDRFEQTIITPLKQKMSRSDDNIGKKYVMGVYGGVPILEEVE